MDLLDLPQELFEMILCQAILVRGVKRGLRLRLVNQHFAREVMRALHTFRLLDHVAFRQTSVNSYKELEFFNAYFEYRIMNEPVEGNRFLNDLRNMALHMVFLSEVHEANENTVHNVVRTLCGTRSSQANREQWVDELRRTSAWEPKELEKQLFGAALCTNTIAFFRRSDKLRNKMMSDLESSRRSCAFGVYIELTARYGNEELLEYLLTEEASIVRSYMKSQLFSLAAKAGRIDIVQFLYSFRRSKEWPWPFKCDPWATEYYLNTIVRETYDPQVWDLIETMRIAHNLPLLPREVLSNKSNICARMNYLDMAAHLVRVGTHAEGAWNCSPTSSYRLAIRTASSRGFVALVELLLDHGADSNYTLFYAASNGRAEVVKLLLDRGVKTSDALFEERRISRPFNFLLKRGANLHSPGTAEECVRRARENGLESMLSLLEQHGVKVNEC